MIVVAVVTAQTDLRQELLRGLKVVISQSSN